MLTNIVWCSHTLFSVYLHCWFVQSSFYWLSASCYLVNVAFCYLHLPCCLANVLLCSLHLRCCLVNMSLSYLHLLWYLLKVLLCYLHLPCWLVNVSLCYLHLPRCLVNVSVCHVRKAFILLTGFSVMSIRLCLPSKQPSVLFINHYVNSSLHAVKWSFCCDLDLVKTSTAHLSSFRLESF